MPSTTCRWPLPQRPAWCATLCPMRMSCALAAASGFSTATDLADWLVRTLKMPFREAHHVAGSLVALAEKQGCDLPELKLEDMQKIESRITKEVYKVLTVEASVASRTSFGGTAPANVAREARRWLKLLK